MKVHRSTSNKNKEKRLIGRCGPKPRILQSLQMETNSLQVIEDHKANHAKLANELRAREAVTGWPSFHPKALKE